MTKIVVGVDDSERAKDALSWAAAEARLRSSTLVVGHVYDVVDGGAATSLRSAAASLSSSDPDVPAGIQAEIQAEAMMVQRWSQALARQVVEGAVTGVDLSDIPVETEVIASNSPAKGLIDLAQDAELLVVGQRGRGGFTGLLLGSVAQQCLRHSPCPVVVVPVNKTSPPA